MVCNDIDDREALTELIDYVTEKNIQIVLVEGADRLARDLLISETILARFRELGCKVVESRSGNDLTNAEDNPTKELVTKILSVVFNVGEENFAEETRRRSQAQARGKLASVKVEKPTARILPKSVRFLLWLVRCGGSPKTKSKSHMLRWPLRLPHRATPTDGVVIGLLNRSGIF